MKHNQLVGILSFEQRHDFNRSSEPATKDRFETLKPYVVMSEERLWTDQFVQVSLKTGEVF